MKKTKLYVYNLAVKREDGKVEQDTIFREKLFTVDDIKDMSTRFNCGVIVSCVGVFVENDDAFIKNNTFTCDAPVVEQVVVDNEVLEPEKVDIDKALKEEVKFGKN